MTARFYLDEDQSDDLAIGLRERGYDAVHTREAGLAGQIDPKQLALAARQGRVLLTANGDHFRMLHEAWLVWSEEGPGERLPPHAGIVILPNQNAMPLADLIAVVDGFFRAPAARDFHNRLLRYRVSIGWEDLSTVR